MSVFELFFIAVGLSMDAFAVSICKGLSFGQIKLKQMCLAGCWFGGFQALMPAVGYFCSNIFTKAIEMYSHWVAFILLVLIGGNMLKEALNKEQEEMDALMTIPAMLVLAVATSIDALAVGVSLAFLQVQIIRPILLIGIITFGMSAVGIKVGSIFGAKYKCGAEFTGGLVLIVMGMKILLEGLGMIG